MYSHSPVSPEILDLLVTAINQRLSQHDNMPLARVEEYNRGANNWSWSFLWQSRLKVADVRMHADQRAIRINFLYLGESKAAQKWVELLYHADDPLWSKAIQFLGDLGQSEYWTLITQELEKCLVQTTGETTPDKN